MDFYRVTVTECWNGSFGDEFNSEIESLYFKDETLARLKFNEFKGIYKNAESGSSWYTFGLQNLSTED